MNYIKLQQDIIKDAFNRDEKGKAFNGFYVKREFETIIGPNQSQAFIIPNDELYILTLKKFSTVEKYQLSKEYSQKSKLTKTILF